MLQHSLIIASFAVHPHNLEMKSYKYKLHKFKILLGPDLGNPASLSRNPILTPPHGVTSRQFKILEISWEERSSGLSLALYLRPRFIQSPIQTALSTSAHAPIGPIVVLTWKWPCYRESVSIRSESVITASEHVDFADSESDSDSSETRFQKKIFRHALKITADLVARGI